MPDFRIKLTSSKAVPAITHDGFVAKQSRFRIQRLSDGRTYTYEGGGGGKHFENRCELLISAGGIVIEDVEPDTNPPSLAWKEGLVNKALAQIELL